MAKLRLVLYDAGRAAPAPGLEPRLSGCTGEVKPPLQAIEIRDLAGRLDAGLGPALRSGSVYLLVARHWLVSSWRFALLTP